MTKDANQNRNQNLNQIEKPSELERRTPVLESARLLLRPFEMKDANDVYEACKEPELGRGCGWPVHVSLEHSKAVLQNILIHPGTWAILSKADGRVIGSISLMEGEEANLALENEEAELGFWLNKDFWKQGLMQEAGSLVIAWAFEERGKKRLKAAYATWNEASGNVQKRLGFEEAGEQNLYAGALGVWRQSMVTVLEKEYWQNRK